MTNSKKNITLDLLLQSLDDDYDKNERNHILDLLKNNDFADDEALLGAKLFLEANNWDYIALKKAFTKTENRINLITASKPKSHKKYLKYAAVLIPIALFLGFLINNKTKSIDTCYIKEEGLPNFMGNKKTNWDELMELYRAKEMKKAYTVSEKILLNRKENDTAIYFHGVIAYELNNYTTAKKDYNKIILDPKSVFYHDATYRLGFVLNHLQEIEASKSQFRKVILDPNNPYKKSAIEASEYLH